MSKVNTGLGNIYYSIATITGFGSEEVISYGEVKPLAPLIEVSVSPSENSNTMYAGDVPFVTQDALGEIDMTFSVPLISDAAMCDLFGYKKATEGGIIRDAKAVRPYVALMFEQNCADGVVDYVTLYKGKLSLPELKGKTKEGQVEFQTKSFNGKFVTPKNGIWMYAVSSDDVDFSRETWATKWGKTVVVPTEKVSEV